LIRFGARDKKHQTSEMLSSRAKKKLSGAAAEAAVTATAAAAAAALSCRRFSRQFTAKVLASGTLGRA